jgi:hypothetical protein
MSLMMNDEVARLMAEAVKAAFNRRVSPEDEDYKRTSVEALCEQFTGACYTLAGADPDQLSVIFNEHAEKAMAIITMTVEVISQLPEGGVSTRDHWERVMKAVDEC